MFKLAWEWRDEALDIHWFLTSEERELLYKKTTHGRLGFAVLLKYFQNEGRFPEHFDEVPRIVLAYLANQIDVPRCDLSDYSLNGRTAKRDRAEILQQLGIRRTTQQDLQDVKKAISVELLPSNPSAEALQAFFLTWFKQRQIAPPTLKQIQRLINTTCSAFESCLQQQIMQGITQDTKTAIDRLLNTSDDDGLDEATPNAETVTQRFSWLKGQAGSANLQNILQAIERINCLKQMPLCAKSMTNIPLKWLHKYHRRALTESNWELRRHPEHIRYPLMAAFCWQRQQDLTDDLIALLIQITHNIGKRAENKIDKHLFEQFKQVRGKNRLLFKLAEVAIEQPKGIIQDVLYPTVGLDTLKNVVIEFKAKTKPEQNEVHHIVRRSYGNHYRRMITPLLHTLDFHCNNQYRPVIDALHYLKTNQQQRGVYFNDTTNIPIQGIIKPKWLDTVIEKESDGTTRINRINYEISVLHALREGLRNKAIWVTGAFRYRNPDEDLPTDFIEKRSTYYQALNLPENPEDLISQLKASLADNLSLTAQSMAKNEHVKILATGKNRIKLTPLTPQIDPVHLTRLKTEVFQRWQGTSLLDVLKEADLRVGFSQCFQSSRQRETLSQEALQKRLLLCLFALGTNTGLKRIAVSGHEASYKELLHTRHTFLEKNALREAIAQVANATLALRNPRIWGAGTTSCASDSKKFGAWDQNLMTEWHVRYGGRGVMIYWHVEAQSLCIYSQLKRCSSSEVSSMIEGVLRHQTDMTIEKSYTDSHGQSEVGFAFCYLLGFDLMPRLKNMASQKLYIPEKGSAKQYSSLESILTRPINWSLIRQHYDEMVKYTTALKLGTAQAESILARFTRNGVQHPTYKALAELGKAVKTIFLCQYIRSEALRQEVNAGLNVVENWNSANSFIFYGDSSEITSNRLEDQELSVLSLHLLQLSLVYVNTLMIQEVLKERQWFDPMREADFRALTPLIYSHINPYGWFELDMDKRLPIDKLAA